jgi:hypothetical protein
MLAAALVAATIAGVVDGDTVRTRGHAGTLQLAGVDAPEGLECGAAEATGALARLLPPGARVKLARGAVYRRGRLVNAALVRSGYVRARGSRFTAAERDARRRGRGIWTACAAPAPAPSAVPPPDATRARLADRMFIVKTGTSIWDTTERRLHLCADGYALDTSSWVFHGNTGSTSAEGAWELVAADATTARVRLFNATGELFRTFAFDGARVTIDGVTVAEAAASDVCAVR